MKHIFKVTTTGISEEYPQNEYSIDGVRVPRLELKIGIEYTFILDVSGFPFYFTTDAIGGSNKLKGIMLDFNDKAYESGEIKITPTIKHKDFNIYYQCNNNRLMGGRIVLK